MIQSPQYRIVVISVTLLILIWGTLAASKLPNELLPDVSTSEIALATNWPGKTVSEIEQTLIVPLENQLQNLTSLKEIKSWVYSGTAWTSMIFHPGTDMERVYIEVLSKINQVPNWPADVQRPRIFNYARGANATLASFFLYADEDTTADEFIRVYRAYVEPAFMRIDGVAELVVPNQDMSERVDIVFDPRKLANNNLSVDMVASRLTNMIDQSGEKITLGSREYGLHFKGKLPLEKMREYPITATQERILRLKDIAEIIKRPAKDWGMVSYNGKKSVFFFANPSENVNVLQTTENIQALITELNSNELANVNMGIGIGFDDSKAIKDSLSLIYTSIILGILLASGVMFLFFRNVKYVFLIFLSIPVSLAIVALSMFAADKSFNVISLAGISLSVGLVLDATIIVVENIQRHYQNGLGLIASISKGSTEVRGALISSTLSSIVIFLPIVMLQSEEGQLFNDLAFTVSSALMASIAVALILMPLLIRYFLTKTASESSSTLLKDKLAHSLSAPARNLMLRNLTLALGFPLAILVTLVAMLDIDVLPDPKQKIISTYISLEEPITPQAVDQNVASVVEERINNSLNDGTAPEFDYYTLRCMPRICFLSFYLSSMKNYEEFTDWIDSSVTNDIVGTNPFTTRNSLLEIAIPDHRSSQIDIKGGRLEELQKAGRELLDYLVERHPDAQIYEDTALENRNVRIEFSPKEARLLYLGMAQSDLNQQLVALTEGVYLGNFLAGSDVVPFYLRGQQATHLDQLLLTEIWIDGEGLVPVRDLVDAKIVLGPESLFRSNRELTVSLYLTAPENMPMGNFLSDIKGSVSSYLAQTDDTGLFVDFRGSVDKLSIFLGDFSRILLMSFVILSLLIWITLKSLRLAAAVIMSLPLAILGGMLMLQFLTLFVGQNLDVVTLIGFIILTGLVVNNAILFVSQYKAAIEQDLSQQEAITQAVKFRIRAIYMSTITSIVGMLPLMLNPSDGAEIYRGLAAVIIGGMLFSVLFTISYMSALLSLPIFRDLPQSDYQRGNQSSQAT